MNRNQIDLLRELVKTSFKMKYNGSLLGFLWVLLKPFMQFLILYVVFSQAGGNRDVKNFTVYLLLGLILYSYFNETFVAAVSSLLDKANIILKVNFDRSLVIYSSVLLGMINLFINLLIILFFSIFFPIFPSLGSLLYFILLILSLTLLLTAVSFFASIINVRLRDLKHIVDIAMQLLFYATPIFYSMDMVPMRIRPLFKLNPLFIIIDASRAALISGDIIHIREIFILFSGSLFLIFVGYIFFQSRIKKIAEFF